MKTLKQIKEDFFHNSGSGSVAAKAAVWDRLEFIFPKAYIVMSKESGSIVVNDDLTVDIEDYNDITRQFRKDIEEFGVQFGEIKRSRCIILSELKNLKTLKGLPKYFGGEIILRDCPKITRLEGLPEEIGGSLSINNTSIRNLEGVGKVGTKLKDRYQKVLHLRENHKLESLDGLGVQDLHTINVDYCHNLTSLKGVKDAVVNYVSCRETNITSLEGCGKVIDGINCNDCVNLKTLKGSPNKIRNLDLTGCHGLKNLVGSPREFISGIILVGCDNITSLAGGPSKMSNFTIKNCPKLTSLAGIPDKIGNSLSCERLPGLKSFEGVGKLDVRFAFTCNFCENLTSLKGLEDTTIGRTFVVQNCDSLVSAEGFPKSVGGDFWYYGTPLKFKKADIQSKVGGKISKAAKR